MSARKIILVSVSVLIPTACARNRETTLPTDPSITGSWVLDEKDSQNPLALIGGAGGPGGFGGGRGTGDPTGGLGGRGGRTGGRGGTGTPGRSTGAIAASRAKIEAAQHKLELLTDMHKKMTITDNGAQIDVTYAIGPQMHYLKRKESTDSLPVLGRVKSKTDWGNGEFVLEQKIGDLSTKEEFTRNIGSTRLVVYTTVKGLARPLEYRRVYDAATNNK